ncbi:MAG: hypothetical protein ACM3TN_27970, partial [Alphaproteobacteria bacterium]
KIKGLENSPSGDFDERGKLLDPINERLPWRPPASDGMFEAMRGIRLCRLSIVYVQREASQKRFEKAFPG